MVIEWNPGGVNKEAKRLSRGIYKVDCEKTNGYQEKKVPDCVNRTQVGQGHKNKDHFNRWSFYMGHKRTAK